MKGLGTAATAALLVSLGSSGTAAMEFSFEWGPTKPCFDRKSPPMQVSDVPAGTAKLQFVMVDSNVPDYPHGGGELAYRQSVKTGYGAFKGNYNGPCPPQTHTYTITLTAKGADGTVLARARASRPFP